MRARSTWRLESLTFAHSHRYIAGKTDWLASGLAVEGQFAEELCAKDIAHGRANLSY